MLQSNLFPNCRKKLVILWCENALKHIDNCIFTKLQSLELSSELIG